MSFCVSLCVGMCTCVQVPMDWVLLRTELQAVGSHPVQKQYMILAAEPSLCLSLNFLITIEKVYFLCDEGLWQGTRRANIYLPQMCPFHLAQHPTSLPYPRNLLSDVVETSALLCYFSQRAAISMRSLPDTPAHSDRLLQTPT